MASRVSESELLSQLDRLVEPSPFGHHPYMGPQDYLKQLWLCLDDDGRYRLAAALLYVAVDNQRVLNRFYAQSLAGKWTYLREVVSQQILSTSSEHETPQESP